MYLREHCAIVVVKVAEGLAAELLAVLETACLIINLPPAHVEILVECTIRRPYLSYNMLHQGQPL